MGMPLDLYVIRHGESEANVIISAGEQGDDSLFTQDNVTVPDRSWRLTAIGRKQADCIGRWLVAQQQLFDRYLVSPYVRTRETAATMALPKAKWEETRVLRERSWGEINTITKDDFKSNYGLYKAVNYHRWDVCKAAILLGQKENLPVYKFLKEPLIRKFGEDWYAELELVVEEMKKQGIL